MSEAKPNNTSAAGATAVTPPPKPAEAEETLAGMAKRWAMAAVSAVTAEAATFPIDFTKTRLQLQNELGSGLKGMPAGEKLGMVRMFSKIVQTEGLMAMYMGLGAAGLRQAVYGGLGIGLYAPVRKLVIGDVHPKDAPLW